MKFTRRQTKKGDKNMERITKFRHNVMSISDLHSFQGIKGGINQDCKDVYFVRAIGVNAAYLSDIQKLDDALSNSMNAGSGYYNRLTALPRMQNVEDTNFYTECYTDWVDAGRKEIYTRVTGSCKPLAEMLSDACDKLERLFKQENKQATDSIVRNFLVKLLFWYDSVFLNGSFRYDEKLVMKVVASNVVKKQEYYFYYLVTLMGCDVLLLQGREDIGAEEEKLALSTKFVLGDFSEVEIPVYQWRESRGTQNVSGQTDNMQTASTGQLQTTTGQGAVNSNGRITVKLPERNRPSKHPAQNQQGAGTRVPGQSTAVGTSSAGQNVSGTQNGSTQGNHRVVIPPRPGRAQSAASTGSTGNQPNSRVVIPPRPGSTQSPAPQRPGTSQSPNTGRPVNITTPTRPAASVVASSEMEKSFEELAMLASSVVLITVFDGKGERLGSGSGIMIGKEGYILTNNHVAAGGRFFTVRIEDDEKEYKTDEIIKYHSVLDLAIIRIQRKLNPIPVYKGTKPLVRGQKVVAIGSPLGLFNSVSDGIISGFRKIDEVDMIQFTAPTSRGSSGGAVLNMQGEVIGISTAGIDAGQNINLAMGYECINMFIRGFI